MHQVPLEDIVAAADRVNMHDYLFLPLVRPSTKCLDFKIKVKNSRDKK
jgi:hypothetical protein